MKKIISVFLILSVIFSITGCGKEKEEKIMSPQYENKFFSTTAIDDISSKYDDASGEIKITRDIIKKINGKILDVYELNSSIYFLTKDGVYNCDKSMLPSYEYKLDVKDNNKFVFITSDFFILKNNKDELTLYTPKSDDFNTFIDTSINIDIKNKVLFIDQNKDDFYSYCLSIVEKIDNKGIKTTKYGLKDRFSDNVKFIKLEEHTLRFSKELESDLKKFYFHIDNDSPNGYILLENGNLYRINTDQEFQNTKTLNINDDVVENVENVYVTSYDYEVFLTKSNDKGILYDVVYYEDFSTNDVTIGEILTFEFPESFTTNDIKNILVDREIIELKNGNCYTRTYDEYTKNETITKIMKENYKKCFMFNEFVTFVMDDGYIYTLLDDYTIEQWNLK